MTHRLSTLIASGFMVMALASPLSAHHEAMFGPQSSAVLSPTRFISFQFFDRENGKDDQTHREATTVFSAGIRPFKKQPLSFAAVLPFTVATNPSDLTRSRFEDAMLSARYKVDASGLAHAWHLDESYVMGVGGVEIPTGNMDHPFGHGPFGEIAAGLFSVERRPIALIAYTYYHHTGEYEGLRQSGNLFAGTGVAYTPIDDDEHGKLFSMQLGLSHEHTFSIEENGVVQPFGGQTGVFLHPGIVFSTNTTFQFFGLVSIPLTQTYDSIDDRQRFRIGAGTIVMFGH
jgi:hypothetical protein